MQLQILEGVKAACTAWGAQKNAMMSSTSQGWHGTSLIERFQSLHDGAAARSQRLNQFREEAHTGEGLLIARAIQGVPPLPHMPLELHEVLFVHYVVRGLTAKDKAAHFGCKVAKYWQLVANAEHWIAARMPIASAEK